jgi:2,3-bisphosphoglycerate-independent phosphoglycerate mutase
MDSNLKAVSSHEEMHKAFVLAGSKVEKTIKDETPSERFHRICDAKEAKQNKKAKSSARTQVRKKVIKKMTVYFPKKNKP